MISKFYQGSLVLDSVAIATGIPIDQINFMTCQIFALLLAFPFRINLHINKVGISARHGISALIGLLIGFFCFGMGFMYMVSQAAMTYVLMKYSPPKLMHIIVFVSLVTYLTVMHIYRMSYDYGGYMLDVSLPIMISTQKLTSLAFSVHDGLHRKKEDLTPDQAQQAVGKFPSVLEFSSYVFYFQGLLAGPLCFYSDYIAFMECSNYKPHMDKLVEKHTGDDASAKREIAEPNPTIVVVKKLIFSLFALSVALFVAPHYDPHLNYDNEFIATSGFCYRVFFMIISITFARSKYYFAWKFGEAINNASGLGFNGYHEDESEKWDLVTNVRIRKLETATSLKVLIDNWNVQTALWLRRVCYDRAPKKHRVLMTFGLSAIWHGFYPGYYFCFIVSTFFTNAAREVRRKVRPHFLHSSLLKFVYDVITWFFAQLTLAYLIVPFVILEFWPCVAFYTYNMYWFLHILVILTLVIAKFVPSPLPSPPKKVE